MTISGLSPVARSPSPATGTAPPHRGAAAAVDHYSVHGSTVGRSSVGYRWAPTGDWLTDQPRKHAQLSGTLRAALRSLDPNRALQGLVNPSRALQQLVVDLQESEAPPVRIRVQAGQVANPKFGDPTSAVDVDMPLQQALVALLDASPQRLTLVYEAQTLLGQAIDALQEHPNIGRTVQETRAAHEAQAGRSPSPPGRYGTAAASTGTARRTSDDVAQSLGGRMSMSMSPPAGVVLQPSSVASAAPHDAAAPFDKQRIDRAKVEQILKKNGFAVPADFKFEVPSIGYQDNPTQDIRRRNTDSLCALPRPSRASLFTTLLDLNQAFATRPVFDGQNAIEAADKRIALAKLGIVFKLDRGRRPAGPPPISTSTAALQAAAFATQPSASAPGVPRRRLPATDASAILHANRRLAAVADLPVQSLSTRQLEWLKSQGFEVSPSFGYMEPTEGSKDERNASIRLANTVALARKRPVAMSDSQFMRVQDGLNAGLEARPFTISRSSYHIAKHILAAEAVPATAPAAPAAPAGTGHALGSPEAARSREPAALQGGARYPTAFNVALFRTGPAARIADQRHSDDSDASAPASPAHKRARSDAASSTPTPTPMPMTTASGRRGSSATVAKPPEIDLTASPPGADRQQQVEQMLAAIGIRMPLGSSFEWPLATDRTGEREVKRRNNTLAVTQMNNGLQITLQKALTDINKLFDLPPFQASNASLANAAARATQALASTVLDADFRTTGTLQPASNTASSRASVRPAVDSTPHRFSQAMRSMLLEFGITATEELTYVIPVDNSMRLESANSRRANTQALLSCRNPTATDSQVEQAIVRLNKQLPNAPFIRYWAYRAESATARGGVPPRVTGGAAGGVAGAAGAPAASDAAAALRP